MQVFYTSPWVPAEWIAAHGFDPRGIWWQDDLDSLSLSAGVCAFAQSAIRFAQAHTEDAIVFTTRCDQMRRSFDAVAQEAGARVFLFNLPATWQTPAAQRLFREELERLGGFLQKIGGHAPSGLAGVMDRYSRARTQLTDSAAWLRAREHAEAVARFHWDGHAEFIPHDPLKHADEGIRAPLALIGGPFPRSQWNLLDLIERAGGAVVLNGTQAGERSLLPIFDNEFSEPPLDILARGYMTQCSDVFQRPNTPLYAWLKERLAARKVKGIVLWHYVGCDLWRAEAQNLRQAFGLPVLTLDADEVCNGSKRNATRLEAFLELLR